MAAVDPPVGWEVFTEAREDGTRWAVRRIGQHRPAAWGLTSRSQAVRWAWRLAGRAARTAPPATPRAGEPNPPPVHPWWAVKD